MRKVNRVIIHCSDSDFGDSALIRKWHIEERGWTDIGYHYVVLNGKRGGEERYKKSLDGLLEVGRDEKVIGAHTYGVNRDSIGVCLIGKGIFTPLQLQTLSILVHSLMKKYGIGVEDVYGHYEFDKRKSCPGVDMNILRAALSKGPVKGE